MLTHLCRSPSLGPSRLPFVRVYRLLGFRRSVSFWQQEQLHFDGGTFFFSPRSADLPLRSPFPFGKRRRPLSHCGYFQSEPARKREQLLSPNIVFFSLIPSQKRRVPHYSSYREPLSPFSQPSKSQKFEVTSKRVPFPFSARPFAAEPAVKTHVRESPFPEIPRSQRFREGIVGFSLPQQTSCSPFSDDG